MTRCHSNWLFDNLAKDVTPLFYSKEQLTSLLSVSPKTVTAWRYRYQDFPARKFVRHVRFNLSEVLQWHERKFGGQKNET